jgi:hypothetical protein
MRRVWILSVAMIVGGMPGLAQAADLSESQGYVDHIRAAEPPQSSTGTKESPVGQPVSDYKPQPSGGTYAEPPSPVNRNNPQNDPDVQRGFDDHQKEYYGE